MSPVTGSSCRRKFKPQTFKINNSFSNYYLCRSVVVGRSSHKVNENFIMRLYYQKDILTFMCCVNELFYVCLYLLHFTYGPLSE